MCVLAVPRTRPEHGFAGHGFAETVFAGTCPGFLKGGGGSNISWFPKKRSSDFKRGGVQWTDGGGVQYISLTRTTNLAYLDAKE